MSRALHLIVPSIVLALSASAAHAEERVFDGSYATREGASVVSLAVGVPTPAEGATQTRRDGTGIRIAAEGAGNLYALNLAVTEGGEARTLSPPRECTPSREGAGCWFDLALLDRSGRDTGTKARVMVQSESGAISSELLAESVRMETRGFGDGLSVELAVDARPHWTDLEVFVEIDHGGILIDWDFPEQEDPPPPPPPPSDLETYKVLSYNVAGLPQTAFSNDDFGPDDDYEERGKDIAAMVIANDYDIIVFSEVFEDTMRETLIDELKAEYPYIIEEAWDGDADTTHRQDSGLMLFSRFEGDPMDIGSECNESSNITVRNLDDGGGTSTCSAAFWPFTDLDGEDSWAEKGFIWARLWNPRTNRPISILGSHTQATYYAVDTELFNDERDARASNFKEILDVVDQVTALDEDLILMGDLNVIGDYDGANSEYMEIFGPAGWIRDHDLGDMWRDTTSPEDPGFSWDGSDGPLGNMVANNDPFAQERLDYMVALDPSALSTKFEAPCFQHMQLRRDFKGPYGDLSDHYGLDAVIGRDSERCSPMRALTNVTGKVNGEIEYAGAYQWYRYDEPGTYTLQVYSPDIDTEVTVYDATDLSTPLGYFEGNGEFDAGDRETTSVLDTPGPFYLRVRSKDPTLTGHYALTLEENDGSSFANYIVLRVGETEHATFGQVLGGLNQDRVHFKFEQKALWSTNMGNQKHKFNMNVCDEIGPCTPGTFTLWDAAQNALYTSASTTTWLDEVSESWLPNVAGHFFVTIDRDTLENTQRNVSMVHYTDLKVVSLGDLTCHEQEDYTGDDHIYADIYVDGTSPAAGDIDLYYGQMDTNGSMMYPDAPAGFDTTAIAFKTEIVMELYEEDDNPDNDDYLGSTTLENGGVTNVAYCNSSISDPELNAKADPNSMTWDGDGAAYSLNWWILED